MSAFRGQQNWRDYFNRIKPKTVLWKNESPLIAILRNGSEWCHVYQGGDPDLGASIFVEHGEMERFRQLGYTADNCPPPANS